MSKPLPYRSMAATALVAVFLLLAGGLWRLIDQKHIVGIQATAEGRTVAVPGKISGITYKGFEAGLDQPYYFRDVFFTGDTAALRQITVSFNGRKIIVTPGQLRRTDTVSPYRYSISHLLPQQRSVLPVFKHFINWAGDGALVKSVLLHPLLLFFMLSVLLFWWWHRRNAGQSLPLPQPAQFGGNRCLWHGAGILLFFLLCALLLQSDTWYFLQDDNYAQFTPVLLKGLDDWYLHLTFPTFNPWQLAGSPTFSLSTYAFVYPPTHIAYLTARYLLGDVYQFNNLFALMHFAVGYWCMYRLLLRLHVHPLMAITAALGFVFCGFNLMAARSWYYVAPAVAWVPLLAHCVLLWQKKSQIKYTLWLGLLFGAFAWSGNFQYWVYVFIFFAVYVLLCGEVPVWARLKKIVVTGAVALLIFSPQLAATYMETAGLDRAGGEGQGIWGGMGALLVPGLNSSLPNGWGRSDLHQFDGHFYYGAAVFLLPALLVLFYGLLYPRRLPRNRSFQVLLVLFLLSFVLALGRAGLLWPLLARLPLLNKFNHPFKFLLFVQFFGIVAGALVVQYALQHLLPAKAGRYVLLLLPATLVFFAWHVSHSRQAFYVYSYHRPYEQPEWLPPASPWHTFHVLPMGPLRSPDTGFDAAFQMNFAMAHGVSSADGYEPLNGASPNLHDHHRQWGIRYFIQSLHRPEPGGLGIQSDDPGRFRYSAGFKRVYESKKIRVFEDTLCEPAVQLRNAADSIMSKDAMYVQYSNDGLLLSNRMPIAGVARVVLAWQWRPGLRVMVNGKSAGLQQDSLGRISIPIREPVHSVRLCYNPYVKH